MREATGKDKLRKLIVFSTQAKRNLIEGMIADEASSTGQTGSALIEEHILNDLMPANKNGRYYIERMYFDGWSVKRVARAVFENAAGGIDWKSRYDNLYPLVRFCHNKSTLSESRINGDEQELYHFRSQLDSIVRLLENCADNMNYQRNDSAALHKENPADQTSYRQNTDTNKSDEISEYLRKEADQARVFLKIANDTPSRINLINIYRFLLDNWEYLKGTTFTYRLLTDMVDLDNNWTETSESRCVFVQIIKELSEEWV